MHQLRRLYVNYALFPSAFYPTDYLYSTDYRVKPHYFLPDYRRRFIRFSSFFMLFHLLCYALRIPRCGASFSGKSVTLTQQFLIKMRRQ